jgi:diadenosine tetraphosphate (Ap4A) HIT family hydrolase
MESFQKVNQGSCDFCSEIQGGTPVLPEISFSPIKTRLYYINGIEDFFLLADASPITAPHILITPSMHIEKFSLLDCNALKKIMSAIVDSIENNETAIFFEHGGHSCLRNGLCSEHAHLHIVISNRFKLEALWGKIRDNGGHISEEYASIQTLIQHGIEPKSKDYLAFGCASKQKEFAYEIFFKKIKSQVLRNHISAAIGTTPHILDLSMRKKAFSETCKWLADRYTPYGHSKTKPFDMATKHRHQPKDECYGCEHDCLRSIKT